MRRSIYYTLPLVLILLALLGPAVFSSKFSKTGTPPAPAGKSSPAAAPVDAPSTAGSSTGAEDRPSPQTPAETGSDMANQPDGNGPAAGFPSAAPEKGPGLFPAAAPDGEYIAINVAVVGKSGELLFGPADVKAPLRNSGDASPLDALEATGLTYDMSVRTPGLVEAIGGQRNKGQGGWMYKVNEEIPPVAAEKKKLSAGDRVIWWYSNSIDAPPPDWEALVRQK